MYSVKGKGIIWDKEANKPLAEFKQGAFNFSDKKTAEKLIKAGYDVEGYVPDMGIPFEDMSVDELKAYAAENGIDIGRSTSHSGIMEKIKEFNEKGGADDEERGIGGGSGDSGNSADGDTEENTADNQG